MADEELEQSIREDYGVEGPIIDELLAKIVMGEIPPKRAEGEQKIEEVSQVSIEKRIEKLEQHAEPVGKEPTFIVNILFDAPEPTKEELKQLKKEVMEKNPGRDTYFIDVGRETGTERELS
jgi:hypothetical protein